MGQDQNLPALPEELFEHVAVRVMATMQVRAWQDARTAAPASWPPGTREAFFDLLRPSYAHLALTLEDRGGLRYPSLRDRATATDFIVAYAATLCSPDARVRAGLQEAARAVATVYSSGWGELQQVKMAAYTDYTLHLYGPLAARDADGTPSLLRPGAPPPIGPYGDVREPMPAELLSTLVDRIRATTRQQVWEAARSRAYRSGAHASGVDAEFGPMRPADGHLLLTQDDRRCLINGRGLASATPEQLAVAYAAAICAPQGHSAAGQQRRGERLLSTVYSSGYEQLREVRRAAEQDFTAYLATATASRAVAPVYAPTSRRAAVSSPALADLRRLHPRSPAETSARVAP